MIFVPKQRGETLDEYAKRLRQYQSWKRRQDKIEIYRAEVAEPMESILDACERKWGTK